MTIVKGGPIVYDILPTKKDKTCTPDYDKDTKMFADKYHTQISNSIIFNKKSKIIPV